MPSIAKGQPNMRLLPYTPIIRPRQTIGKGFKQAKRQQEFPPPSGTQAHHRESQKAANIYPEILIWASSHDNELHQIETNSEF